jgi:hydrogenase maturation protease
VADGPVRVIGVGNLLRADDAAGILVARRLRARPGVRILEQNGEPAALLEALRGARAAFVADAAAGSEPGRVHRLDAVKQTLPAGLFACSTHGVGVAEAIELARALGALPPVCLVYALEGTRFENGAALSEALARALPEAAARIEADLDAVLHGETADA